MDKIWGDLDDPGGLGRREAPDFGTEGTHLGPSRPPDPFLAKTLQVRFFCRILLSWSLADS